MNELLPIFLTLTWQYTLEAHPNYPDYPATSYHVESVDCGPANSGAAPPFWQDYFNVESFPNDIPFIAEPSVVWQMPVEDWLRQYTSLADHCHNDAGELHSGVYIWVAPSDTLIGEGPPFKAWWVNIWGADGNHNGQIGPQDFLAFAVCYQHGDPTEPGCDSSDLNHSGAVDAADFLEFSKSYNGMQPNLVWEVPLSSFNRECHPWGPECP